jgi:hypothetical protein
VETANKPQATPLINRNIVFFKKRPESIEKQIRNKVKSTFVETTDISPVDPFLHLDHTPDDFFDGISA